jgi:hypothetical protein
MSVGSAEPLLFAHIEDSDYVFVAAAWSGIVRARMVINADRAGGYVDGVWATTECARLYGREWRRQAAAAMAEWSLRAPTAVETGQVLAVLDHEWDLAEAGLNQFLTALNLPRLEFKG